MRYIPPAMDGLPIPDDCSEAIAHMGEEFLASLYGIATSRHPDNIEVLCELGHVYTRLGRYREGLDVDRRLVEFAPEDPTVRYNLACSEALVGDHDAALDTLETALELGYKDFDFLRGDSDLASLRGEPRFHELIASYE